MSQVFPVTPSLQNALCRPSAMVTFPYVLRLPTPISTLMHRCLYTIFVCVHHTLIFSLCQVDTIKKCVLYIMKFILCFYSEYKQYHIPQQAQSLPQRYRLAHPVAYLLYQVQRVDEIHLYRHRERKTV